MKPNETKLLLLYLLFDTILLNISLYMLSCLGAELGWEVPDNLRIYILHANLSWLITYFVFSKKNLYLRDGFSNRLVRITLRSLVFLAVSSVVGFLVLAQSLSRLFLLEYVAVFYVLKLVFYYMLYQYLKFIRQKGQHVNKVLIVGVCDTTQHMRTVIDSNPMLGYRFEGYLSRHPEKDRWVIGHPDELAAKIREREIEIVFVAISLFSQSLRAKEYLRICNQMGVRLRFIP